MERFSLVCLFVCLFRFLGSGFLGAPSGDDATCRTLVGGATGVSDGVVPTDRVRPDEAPPTGPSANRRRRFAAHPPAALKWPKKKPATLGYSKE